jgi:hypothetical protein
MFNQIRWLKPTAIWKGRRRKDSCNEEYLLPSVSTDGSSKLTEEPALAT